MPEGHRRCCVFGAAGWTGRAVVAELLAPAAPGPAEATAVVAFDIGPAAWENPIAAADGAAPSAAELRYGDIADFETVREAVRGCDSVVHTTVATTGDSPTSSANLYGASAAEETTW